VLKTAATHFKTVQQTPVKQQHNLGSQRNMLGKRSIELEEDGSVKKDSKGAADIVTLREPLKDSLPQPEKQMGVMQYTTSPEGGQK
jgi:hypothetical protein